MMIAPCGEGWAWKCGACGRSCGLPVAGLPAEATVPFMSREVKDRGLVPAEVLARESASAHTERVCTTK